LRDGFFFFQLFGRRELKKLKTSLAQSRCRFAGQTPASPDR
jgi:hypothetical protein